MATVALGDLLAILELENFEELAPIIQRNFYSNCQREYFDSITKGANARTDHIRYSIAMMTRSILATLMEPACYPIVILWCVAGAVSVSFAEMAFICAAFGVVVISVLRIYAIGTYCKLKEESRERESMRQLVGLQLLCIDVLLTKLGKSSEEIAAMKNAYQEEVEQTTELSQRQSLEEETDEKKFIHLKDAMDILLISWLTLITYYVTIQCVANVLEYASLALVMASTAGIGMAIIISFGIAAYSATKQYQDDIGIEKEENHLAELRDEIKYFSRICKQPQDISAENTPPAKIQASQDRQFVSSKNINSYGAGAPNNINLLFNDRRKPRDNFQPYVSILKKNPSSRGV